MPTPRKRWPNAAAWARDGAAGELVVAIRMLRPLVLGDHSFDRTEVLRRQATALSAAQAALRQLEGVGAQTRHEEA